MSFVHDCRQVARSSIAKQGFSLFVDRCVLIIISFWVAEYDTGSAEGSSTTNRTHLSSDEHVTYQFVCLNWIELTLSVFSFVLVCHDNNDWWFFFNKNILFFIFIIFLLLINKQPRIRFMLLDLLEVSFVYFFSWNNFYEIRFCFNFQSYVMRIGCLDSILKYYSTMMMIMWNNWTHFFDFRNAKQDPKKLAQLHREQQEQVNREQNLMNKVKIRFDSIRKNRNDLLQSKRICLLVVVAVEVSLVELIFCFVIYLFFFSLAPSRNALSSSTGSIHMKQF